MDWQHEGLPPFVDGLHFEIWRGNGEVRKVWRPCFPDGFLHYEDCTHPAQNAYCPDSDVQAWRVCQPQAIASWQSR